jgi:putative ABC transport system permease protein
MPNRPARLARLLPNAARRDWFEPALADLEFERARRAQQACSRWARLGQAAWHRTCVLGLFVSCWRLALLEWATSAALPVPPALVPPRKEWLAMILRDLRHALRLFTHEPALAAAVILTLALGIGANTALFAVVDAVLLRPLPYPDAARLVLVKHRDTRTNLTKHDIAVGDFVDLAGRQRSFESFAGYYGHQSAFVGEGDPRLVQGVTVTPTVFDVLDLQPVIGRAFQASDIVEGAAPVVIVSYELWRTDLGSDPAVLSRSIQLGTTRRLVVGVAPPGFRFPPGNPTEVILPHVVPAAAPAARRAGWIYGIGRLAAGVPIERADAELATLSAQLEGEYPQQNLGSRYYAESLRDGLVGDTKRALVLLLASVGFVLLIACANVGNLLLARSLARQPEMAMRLALGAGRGRLVAQTLTEGLVLALAGGVVGVLVAWRAAPALAAMVPEAVAVPGLELVGLNRWVLGFSLGASLTAAVVSSAVACLGLVRDHNRRALNGQRRATMSGTARRAASGLVVAEIALAVVLLLGAGLTLRSFARLVSVDPGVSADGVVTVQVGLPAGRYRDQSARSAAYRRLFDAIAALPGVESVGAAAVTPLTGNNWTAPLVRPEQPLAAGQRPPEVGWQLASSGYFEALRIPLRAGRRFDARDTADTPPVVIVSDALAERYFPGEDPIGKRIRLEDGTAEIVGRVGDIRRASLRDAPRADLYFPFERQNGNGITLFVRTTGDPLAVVPALRAAARQVEPGLIIAQVRSLSEVAAASAAVARLSMRLLGGFAVIALVLAAVGIYGVMSYSVRRRTRELGTRLALGASRGDIVGLVMRQAAVIAGVGLAAGLGLGLVAARSLAAVLYDVPPWDPLALAAAGGVLTATALGASYLPARRAARVDPATTLATE